jgi:cystathionine gamma-lyase
MDGQYGDSTRSVKAVTSQAIPGQPVAPQPVSASTYYLSPDDSDGLDRYGRSSNPTWRQLELALAELEGAAAALTFGSGMAAITSVLRVLTKPGVRLVVPADGYYQVRRYAVEYLAPKGVTVVEATTANMYDAASAAAVVLVETPTNPGPRRRRPASARAHLPWPRSILGRRQHHRDPAGPAATLAGG